MRHFFCDSLKRFFVAFVATLAFVAPTFAANLPSGYTELEYIKSDGTAYIDTDIVPGGKKIGMQAGFKYENLQSATATIIGSGTSDGVDNCRLWGTFNGKWRIKLANQGMSSGTPDTNYHEVRVNMSDGGAYLDGTKVWNVSQITIPSTNTKVLRLFSDNAGGGTSSSSRIYYVRLYQDNDTLIAEYIPTKNSSNEIGFYDTKNNRFLTAPSTFTAGPVVCPNGSTLDTRHASGLPVGYTRLDYIESTGTQYIDTGYAWTSTNRGAEIDFIKTADVTASHLFASSDQGAQAPNKYDLNPFFGGNGFSTYIGSSGYASYNFSNNVRYNAKFDLNNTNLSLSVNDATPVTASIVNIPTTGVSVYLFHAHVARATQTYYPSKLKLYSFKMFDNGTMVRNFIPAKNSSGVIGLYDMVGGQFFTNAGTGTFTAGDEVSDPIVEQCVAGTQIKIATTKYTEDAFAGLMTTLSEAITKVTNIVDTTVQQATEIGNLATTKQDRPDTDCPAGRKCLLIMGADNKPHWYLIQE